MGKLTIFMVILNSKLDVPWGYPRFSMGEQSSSFRIFIVMGFKSWENYDFRIFMGFNGVYVHLIEILTG
jgi:hypothetical protein